MRLFLSESAIFRGLLLITAVDVGILRGMGKTVWGIAEGTLDSLSYVNLLERHPKGHFIPFYTLKRHPGSQSRGYLRLWPLKVHRRGHFVTFNPQERHSRGRLIQLYPLERHPRGHFISFCVCIV